ncbi:hypothetical protein V5O48_002288 [Marasmius crinis-equi]|uniref:Uncharacterized protein n=1 Tax=Marasmius crinis-equi TaxID=585013 RepID=A0ABR3FW33_9AGAR
MFLLNRYLPFIDTFLSIDVYFRSMSPGECLARTTAMLWFMYIGITLSEVILMLRTYALWERRRSILLTLCFTAVALMTPGLFFLQKEIQSFRYAPSDQPGCLLTDASNIVFISYIMLLAGETIVAGLTLVKGYQHLRRTRSPWVVQLYQDGILFYVYLLTLSLGNIITSVVNPEMGPWLSSPQRTLHSLLSTRVLFLLFRGQRTSAQDHEHRTTAFSLTSSAVVSADLMDDPSMEWELGKPRLRHPG